MARTRKGLDNRERSRSGRIHKKRSDALVGTIRKEYGPKFAAKYGPRGNLPYAHFRQHLAKHMEDVWENSTALRVTHKGKTVVVVSELEYNGLIETNYLLRSPANARHLLESIAEANAGKLQEHELAE